MSKRAKQERSLYIKKGFLLKVKRFFKDLIIYCIDSINYSNPINF
jgi:hypothetical protein